MPDIRYWIGLSMVPDVGPITARQLISGFRGPEEIFSANVDDLLTMPGMTKARARNIRGFSGWDEVEKQVRVMEKKGISALCYGDACYPEILKEIPDSPVVIYIKGEYRPEDRYAIAVVGSRRYSPYGEVVTGTISSELAASGFTIISGMARGIDTFAHRSALSAGGRTIAVLGSGLDVYYPAENKGLMQKISESGCAMSEFPPGTPPNRENFPRRNRLISGLSMGVLVVEAAEASGSLITASIALEQNREVFAVPGNITSRTSTGTNMLIRQGAKMVMRAEDIIEELAPALKGFIKSETKRSVELTDAEQAVCGCLSREPVHIDIFARGIKLPVNKILDILLSLELKGVVRQSDGKRFYLA